MTPQTKPLNSSLWDLHTTIKLPQRQDEIKRRNPDRGVKRAHRAQLSLYPSTVEPHLFHPHCPALPVNWPHRSRMGPSLLWPLDGDAALHFPSLQFIWIVDDLICLPINEVLLCWSTPRGRVRNHLSLVVSA